jgi:hypothetical protein
MAQRGAWGGAAIGDAWVIPFTGRSVSALVPLPRQQRNVVNGWGEIRTRETVSRPHAFQAVPFPTRSRHPAGLPSDVAAIRRSDAAAMSGSNALIYHQELSPACSHSPCWRVGACCVYNRPRSARLNLNQQPLAPESVPTIPTDFSTPQCRHVPPPTGHGTARQRIKMTVY